MISTDEDLFICDMAETYTILNYRGVPAKLLATLACGLRESSRIKMKMANLSANQTDLLLSALVDKLAFLVWAQTEDGQKGRNRPNSVLQLFLNEKDDNDSQLMTFESGEEFEQERQKILKGES